MGWKLVDALLWLSAIGSVESDYLFKKYHLLSEFSASEPSVIKIAKSLVFRSRLSLRRELN